jgi:hypothetical protein
MAKLVPHWGRSAQPGGSYYKMKLSTDICVLVDHMTNKADIIVFDEKMGSKNSNHTLTVHSYSLPTGEGARVGETRAYIYG